MKIDSAPSQVATSALQAIPFSSIIGGPLNACIKAQAMAAKTTWQFIQEVGLQYTKEDREDDKNETPTKKAINVSFTFIQNGNTVRLNIPLLTIIPIPYIAIQNIDVAFKANISASSSTAEEQTSNNQFNQEITEGGKIGWGMYGVEFNMKGGYSSKKDSRATQDSKYSVEYTMDVDVRAGQENMPAGLAKVLEILNNSLNVCNPNGELGVNENYFVAENSSSIKEQLVVTYKNPNGLYEPDAIKVTNNGETLKSTEDMLAGSNSRIYELTKEGTYTVTAGKVSETVEVKTKGNLPTT